MHETEAAEVLELAADNLFVHGFYKGSLKDPNSDARCTVGHVGLAVDTLYPYNTVGFCDARGLLESARERDQVGRRALVAMGNITERNIVGWSDDPLTTAEEVRDTMLAAAKNLRNRA